MFRNALELLLRFIAAPAVKIQLENLPLPHIFHLRVAESGECVLNCLSLRIEYGALWHYPDVCFHDFSITLLRRESWLVPLVCVRKRGLQAHLDEPSQLFLPEPHSCRALVLRPEGRVEHGRIIGGEHDGYPMPQECWEWMIFESYLFAPKLPGERARFQVASGADFQWNLPLCKQIHQRRVVDRRDAMSGAFGTQYLDGFPDFFRPAHLAGMHQAVQSHLRGFFINGAKLFGRNTQLVTANAESNDGLRAASACGLQHLHGGLGTELARGIKHPTDAQAAALERLGRSKKGFEIRFRRLLP